MSELTRHNEGITHDRLSRRFLLYIGPVNATAINRFDEQGNRHAYDQHLVRFTRRDRPDIDVWEEGTLKVYCPSVLLAFAPGDEFQLLNKLLFQAEPLLYEETPLIEAVKRTASPNEFTLFINALNKYVDSNQGTPHLARNALRINFSSYDRSIQLQTAFQKENQEIDLDSRDVRTQAIYTLARQKVIFIAMAPHYAVEAVFDDQFANFPYHLPDYVQRTIGENIPICSYPFLDQQAYERGLTNVLIGAPNPDLYRFDPILASLIAPFVIKEDGTFDHYDGWDDFERRVISKVEDPTTHEAMQLFAKGMGGIPVEFAFFAAYKMCQKEVRKRGIKRIYSPRAAKDRAQRIAADFSENREYFSAKDPYLRLNYYEEIEGGLEDNNGNKISKRRFQEYRQAVIDRTGIEYVNSVIGTYKFVPWKKDDRNFSGLYLPYAVMKSEKARIVKILCSEEFLPFWRERGYWFRDALPELLNSHPSMYSKWFIPLLEKGMIDNSLIKEADQHVYRYLSLLAT